MPLPHFKMIRENFADMSVLTMIFRVRSDKMPKNSPIFFADYEKKTKFILINIFSPTFVPKFGDFSLKNESRNAKRGRLIKWSIMHIFNEAEPP